MENEKSFLETWKEVIYKLRDEGLITQEDIEDGVDLPIEWLYSSGIHRDAVMLALRNLYEMQHQNNRYQFNRFKSKSNLKYCEKDGKPAIEVFAGKCSIFITDEKMQSQGWSKNVTTQEFISKIISAKKRLKMVELMEKGKMSREDAITAVGIIYDDKQIQSDLYGMPNNLKEMGLNFGEYYKYIKEEQEISADEEGPIEIAGGIIEPVVDIVGPRAPVTDTAKPRVSDIYAFEQRDEVFRNLKPERVIKFKGINQDTREVIDGVLTCYIYKKPQGNDGYIVISEPLEGNKETQSFYLSTEFVESLKADEQDINKFWKDLVTEYVEKMSRSEFAREERTHTFRHTTDLEAYRQKIEGIINGVENNSQKATVRRASRRLFGRETYKSGINGVKRSGFSQAEKLLDDRETSQAKEGEDVTND